MDVIIALFDSFFIHAIICNRNFELLDELKAKEWHAYIQMTELCNTGCNLFALGNRSRTTICRVCTQSKNLANNRFLYYYISFLSSCSSKEQHRCSKYPSSNLLSLNHPTKHSKFMAASIHIHLKPPMTLSWIGWPNRNVFVSIFGSNNG